MKRSGPPKLRAPSWSSTYFFRGSEVASEADEPFHWFLEAIIWPLERWSLPFLQLRIPTPRQKKAAKGQWEPVSPDRVRDRITCLNRAPGV